MPAIGITGGISTGKSTFCDCLREILPAAKFFDADLAARSFAELPEVKQEILGQFGSEVFSPTGDLNRAKLRAIVFSNATKRRALEQIINSQMALEEKIKRADHVVWNNGDRAMLMEQAKSLVALWQEQSWKKS